MKSDCYKEILTLINRYIERSVSYDDFEKMFYSMYEDAIPVESPYQDFVWGLEEKVSFAAQKPDAESKSYGYIDADNFRIWLRDYKNAHIDLWKKCNLL